jgi:hypothetical protein
MLALPAEGTIKSIFSFFAHFRISKTNTITMT